MQDQFIKEEVSGIPEDNFSINIELFWQTFTCIELLRCKNVPNVKLFRWDDKEGLGKEYKKWQEMEVGEPGSQAGRGYVIMRGRKG